MAFKVKYRTRARLQRAIQQTITRLGLVDTSTMRDSIRISAVTGDLNQITITVNCIYYYPFLDLGTRDIAPQDITAKALQTSQGRQFLEETVQQYMDYLTQEYPILDVATLKINPQVSLQYNIFGGGAYGYPNGIFNPNKTLRV